MNIPDGYPEVLADLATLIVNCLAGELPTDQAEIYAWRITERLRLTWGGQEVYIPRGVTYEAMQRDRRLYEQFTGANHEELSDAFGLSLREVYYTIDRERARRRRSRELV